MDLSLRISLGIYLYFPISFWSYLFYMLIVSFYFFSILVYMIYHVVFQVSSKVIQLYTYMYLGFPLGSVVKESPCNEGDLGSIPGLGRYAQRDMTSISSILA